ncbi:MAG: PAS domain S-box protein [Syntrophaceae bacterium]|nr:PAS domain S-box protein [Syntrophaceae bacterium]
MNMKLNPFTLKFSGESSGFEEPFLRDYYLSSLNHVRVLLLLGAILYAAFGILDMLVMPQKMFVMWFIRFIVVGPGLVSVLLLSFSRIFEKYMQRVLAFAYFIAGTGIICMIAIAPAPVSYSYYAGLMLVFIWGYTLIRLFFIWACLAGWVMVILYGITAVWINPTPHSVLISNFFFFFSANFMGMIACYAIEFYARRDFFLNKRLEIEGENIGRMNVVLRESEEKYRSILENIRDGYFEVDLTGNFTFFNNSLCRITGYSKEELSGVNYKKFSDERTSDKVFQAFNKIYKTGVPNEGFDWPIMRKDGMKRYIEASVSLRKDSSDKIIGFRGILRDSTERKQAEMELQQILESLKNAVGTTIQVLVAALETRDPYTADHQFRAAHLAGAIAVELGLPGDKVEGIRMAGRIHDIGKLSVPAEILNKAAKLTDVEFSMIKQHAHSGYEMLKNVESPWPLAQIVYQHHERINGTGYPLNLKEDEILLESRILAVADVVEAMASHRPYRPALGIKMALEEVEKNKRILYDEVVADACLKLFREKNYQLP